MTRGYFFLSPGKYTPNLILFSTSTTAKNSCKRNHLQLVNKGALLARRAIRISVDGGHQSYNANPDNFASSRRHQAMILRLRLCVVKPDPENNRKRFELCAYPHLVGAVRNSLTMKNSDASVPSRKAQGVFYQASGSFLGRLPGLSPLNIEDIQNRALRCGCASTSGDCLCQQPFQLA